MDSLLSQGHHLGTSGGFSTWNPWETFAGLPDPQILSFQAESFSENAIEFAKELAEAEGENPRPAGASWRGRQEGAALVDGGAQLSSLHGLCSELGPGRRCTHQGDSPHRLSMKCSL